MENKTNCWVDLKTINIPSVEKQGFQEDIVIRKKVQPVIMKRPKQPIVSNDITSDDLFAVIKEQDANYDGEEATVLLFGEDHDGEEATVLLNKKLVAELYLKQQKTGEIFRVDKDEFVIGKSQKSDFVVKDNRTVSRQHVVIRRGGGGFIMEDLDSGNHTYVEGEMIENPVKLVDGMKFTLSLDEVFEVMINTRFE